MSQFDDFFSEEESYYDISYSDDTLPNPHISESAPDPIYSLINGQISASSSHSSPPPQIADGDPAIAFSTSINQSRQLISTGFGTDPSHIHSSSVPGLLVLRIQDFTLLRADSRCGRVVPHLIIHGPSLDPMRHPDFAQSLRVLNQ